MTVNLRKKLTVILLVVVIIASGIAAFFAFRGRKASAEIFTHPETVTLTKEQALSQTFLGGAKGYMFSTVNNGATVSLKDGAAGKFSIKFTPCASTVGEAEFNSFAFNFKSESARLGFGLEFVPAETGVVMNVSFTNTPLVKRQVFFDGAFDNTSDKAISFSFDPVLMQVYNAEGDAVADFKSAEYMKNFDMVTLIDSYERYSVDMVFGGITQGKTAKVILFEVCGQKLDASELTNTSAPVIFKDNYLTAGVKGKAYAIKTDVHTFDVKDGFRETFNGKITVTDGLNNFVSVADGYVFTPSDFGIYYVNYTPVDSDGKEGNVYSYPVYVFEKQPKIDFRFAYPINDVSVGAGTKISFGNVTAFTELSVNPLVVRVIVKSGDTEVYSSDDCANGFKYTFDTAGTYTVVFSATDSVGYTEEKSVTVTVTNSAIFKNAELKDVYARDVSLNFTAVCASDGTNTFTAKAIVTYPDGRTNDSGSVVLDEEGVYSVEFVSDVNGVTVTDTKYFTVRNDNVSLWEEQAGLTITSNAEAPLYADDDYCGTLLTATRPIEAVFRNVVDLSDNTSDDMLIELFVAPTVAGAIETSCIDIIFTDIHDREKVLDIRLARDAWKWDSMKDSMSIIAQPKRDFDLKYLQDVCTGSNNYQQYYYYAQSIYSSLFGKIDNNNESSVSQSVKLYFDYETGKVYANMATKNSVKGKVCVADLTDEKYVGTGKAWKKFTTGEVELSIKISSLTQTANVMILNIDGQSMAGTYTTDTTAPSIFIDYAGNSENSIPCGIKGKPYKIFTAYSRDVAEGLKKGVDVKVFKNIGVDLLDVENNGSEFIPDTTGEYVIRYSVADGAGNEMEKDVKVTVKEENEIPDKTYQFNKDLESEVAVGSTYLYKNGTALGGSGALTASVKITKDGKEIVLDENGRFTITEDGKYLVSVVVSDYLGQSQPFVYEINATYSDKPIITTRTMPKAIIKGEKFVFPEFTATKYTVSGAESVAVEYWVNGVKLSSNEYTPESADPLNVQVKAGASVLDYVLGVTESEMGKQYVTRFFYTNAIQKVLERSATFTFSEPAFVSIVKPVSVDFANFTVASEEVVGEFGGESVSYVPGANLSKIQFTVTDAVYPDISFTANIYKKDSLESYLEYRGVKYVIVDAVFGSYSKNFKVEFNKEDNTLIIGGREICKITHCNNGDVFHGFKGGSIYLDFAMPEVENEAIAAIGIAEFAGQSFDISKTSAKSKPSIKVLGEFEAVEVGEDFVIPKATAFDFMNDVQSLKVTVTAPDGSVLINGENADVDKTVKATWCGNYKIVYEAKNSVGLSYARNFSLTVLDRVPPVITLSGEVQKAAELDKVVKLPEMEVTDDNTAVEEIVTYVYVIKPNASSIALENYEFTPDKKGTYTVVYYAADSYNAIATKIFYIVVG